uniref:DNA-directed RNA polymerase III subunit RPC5 n=1 Tax=Megaselia scalaris TaxID=36166 RepID=T1GGW6_MEGSC
MEIEDDEADFIVEEIPVFLSKNLEKNLYVFQYPTKSSSSSTFENTTVSNCCVKPINQEVKVDFELNVESNFYDQFKGRNFALASDGKAQQKGERPTFRHGIMDKQSFVSGKSVENVDRYVVGILQDKEIHLSPLANILQLRPTFSYFDKEDKRTKAEEKAANDEEDEEELQQVTVKFSRADNERIKKAREKTYDYQMKKTSPTSELERQKLFAMNQEKVTAFSLNNEEYVEKLMPSQNNEINIENILPAKVISKARLKNMTLNDQLKVLLKDAKMLKFTKILELIQECDKTITAEKLIRALPLVGILLRGNWIAQSEILFPAETLSNSNGVSADLMIRARDYIIYKFSRQQYLHRKQIINATQLPPDEVLDILKSVAHLNIEKKWELILPPDLEFESRNPELVTRQQMIWKAAEQNYLDMERDGEKSPKRVRKRSTREYKRSESSN